MLGVNFGCECLWGPEAVEKKGRIIHGKDLLKKFAETFPGNLPKIRLVQNCDARHAVFKSLLFGHRERQTCLEPSVSP